MRGIGFAALGLVLITAACTPRPAPPVSVAPPDAPLDAPATELRRFDDEAPALAAYPDHARRAGNVLTVSLEGRPVARFTSTAQSDCEGYETCSLWAFSGLWRRGDATYAIVMRDHGEGQDFIAVGRDGHLTWLGMLLTSPDGRYTAWGDTGDGLTDAHVVVHDWMTNVPYRSGAPCAPVAWRDSTTLMLHCKRQDHSIQDSLASPHEQSWKITPASQHFADLVPDPETAAGRTEREAWQRKEGYERLVP